MGRGIGHIEENYEFPAWLALENTTMFFHGFVAGGAQRFHGHDRHLLPCFQLPSTQRKQQANAAQGCCPVADPKVKFVKSKFAGNKSPGFEIGCFVPPSYLGTNRAGHVSADSWPARSPPIPKNPKAGPCLFCGTYTVPI
jgi:hypothetical protein